MGENESKEKGFKLIDEVGETIFKKYCLIYGQFRKNEANISNYINDFSEYLQSIKYDKKGYRKISKFSFEQFLLKKYYGNL